MQCRRRVCRLSGGSWLYACATVAPGLTAHPHLAAARQQGPPTSSGTDYKGSRDGDWRSSGGQSGGGFTRVHAPPAGVAAVLLPDGTVPAGGTASGMPTWLEASTRLEGSTLSGKVPPGVLSSGGPVAAKRAAAQAHLLGTPPPSAAGSVAPGAPAAPAAAAGAGAPPRWVPSAAVPPPRSPTAAEGYHPLLSQLPTYGWQRCLVDFSAVTFCRHADGSLQELGSGSSATVRQAVEDPDARGA